MTSNKLNKWTMRSASSNLQWPINIQHNNNMNTIRVNDRKEKYVIWLIQFISKRHWSSIINQFPTSCSESDRVFQDCTVNESRTSVSLYPVDFWGQSWVCCKQGWCSHEMQRQRVTSSGCSMLQQIFYGYGLPCWSWAVPSSVALLSAGYVRTSL